MRVVFICQAVNQRDPIQATTVRWIKALAGKPQVEAVTVIALRKGRFTLPDNVTVCAIKGTNRLITLTRFYKEMLRAVLRKTDCFFVYQGGPYPALLLPFKLITGKPIYQWKAHPYVSLMMRFYARFCDTKVFTSTQNAFPLNLPNIRVVGQGVDTAEFRLKHVIKTGDLVTVGRISPVKRLDRMIRAVARCNCRYGTSYRLDIYGPTLEKDREYREGLEALISELNLSAMVSFRGIAPQDQLPDILNRYQLFLNFSETALDRAVVEAMACGLPVISANPCVEEILPLELRDLLTLPEEDMDMQAERIHRLLSLDDVRLAETGRTLREVVVRDHSVEALFDKILAEMDGCR